MKKTRYIPYGYTIRNGKTVIERSEADVIRKIFNDYVNGYSLNDLSEYLTSQKVPYTSKKVEWNKARIARIIDNLKYIGDEEYDPIIDEALYEHAVRCKTARQRNNESTTCDGINTIRNRIKCGYCEEMMVRRYTSKCKIRESWQCSNSECGIRVRITDGLLLEKLTILLNRIIENNRLLSPKSKQEASDEPHYIQKLINELNQEMSCPSVSEDKILANIREIASARYINSNAKQRVTIQIIQNRVRMMKIQKEFNADYFNDLIEYIIMNDGCELQLITKTETIIREEKEKWKE